MKRILIIAVLLLSLVAIVLADEPVVGSDSIGDSYYPGLGNGGYDVQHYTIALNVDVEANYIQGRTIIEAIALKDMDAFNLDFSGLNIQKAQVNGQMALATRSGSELTLLPLSPLKEGEAFNLVIIYEGVPGQGLENQDMVFSEGWIAYDGGVVVANEPDGASRWYPVNDHPLDKATYRYEITVPPPYIVAANGLQVEKIDNEDGTGTYIWEHNYPLASYLAGIYIGDFVVQQEEGPEGVVIRNYFPQDVAEKGAEVFGEQAEMIAFFNSIFGPYPFEAYGVIVADAELPFALEVQTLSLFGKQSITEGRGSRTTPIETVIAHELVHQWFGDSVTLSDWQDIWLNEGFATYGSALWTEHKYGQAALDGTIVYFYDVMTGQTDDFDGIPEENLDEILIEEFTPPGDPTPEDLFNTSVYLRGALVLHALRLEIGDNAFFELLREFAERYQYGNTSIDEFIVLAEDISGQELGEFFDAWLYDPLTPDIPQMGLSRH